LGIGISGVESRHSTIKDRFRNEKAAAPKA